MSYNKETVRNLYLAILNNYPDFPGTEPAKLEYDLDAPEWDALRRDYDLERIAKKGTSLERARRLLHYLAPRLKHASFYDNHVPCNAPALLAYCFNNAEHGINCLNKSKILAECCLALGIYARRVFISPFSPFDFDSHVVCEIYDEALGKWVMLDPSMDGYFVDDARTPLSMLEIRSRFTAGSFLTFVHTTARNGDLQKTAARNWEINLYFMKNCFRISFEPYNGFGEIEGTVCLVPEHYSVRRNNALNVHFRVENMPPEYRHLLAAQENYLEKYSHAEEPTSYSAESFYAAPGK